MLVKLINSYPSLFSDTQSQTHLIKQGIDVRGAEPVKQSFYHVTDKKKQQVEAEVQYRLNNGIAEPCSSN